jgi:O-antigen/teichoic acid export membrane protein
MTRRSRIWLVVALLFTLLNLVAAGMAALGGELLHTCIHAALLLLGSYFVWRLGLRREVSS